MFQCGDMVVYGIQGVCRIADIEEKNLNGRSIAYFVLEPANQAGAQYFVPKDNPAATSKLRKVISRADVDALLDSDEVKQDVWIADENQRKAKYRELIARPNCAELLGVLRSLYLHKQERLAEGKKPHICDENFMRDAERLIRTELAFALDIPQETVAAYLQEKLEK